MSLWTSLFALLVLAASPAPSGAPPAASSPASPAPGASPASGPVIFFLVDNSASLPPLDPDEKRVEALEKMFGFLKGQPYRLILFGGRHEVSVDDPGLYRNTGLWTDFYFAFDRARALAKEYPKGTEIRLVLLTDAILDPGPSDWGDLDVPPGRDVRAHSAEKTIELVREMGLPLYVILVGHAPMDGALQDPERTPGLIRDLVEAANGKKAAPLAQTLASFFADDGVLLKKFVFRVAPHEGLAKIKPIVQRVAPPARPWVELELLGGFVLPLVLLVFLLLGILVRSFPGPGDVEIVELALDTPVHVAADRLHKLESGGWGASGLSLVGDIKDASATFTYQRPTLDLRGAEVGLEGADELVRRLVPLPLDEMKKALEESAAHGAKEEKISALNLDYRARNMSAPEASRVLNLPASEKRHLAAVDFVAAKAHLLTNDALRRSLTEPRAVAVSYGSGGERKELEAGGAFHVGRYGFVVQDVVKGGRKDARLVLHYDRIPSLLGLKRWLPGAFQRAFRFRRSSQRLVA
jgi:hypothetical protein